MVHRLCFRQPNEPAGTAEPLTAAEWRSLADGRPAGDVVDRARRRSALPPHPAWTAWMAGGTWAVSAVEPSYPRRLASVLGRSAPPLLFGRGALATCHRPGIAVVGSRDAAPEALELAFRLGDQCRRRGLVVFSGAARGCDKAAMDGALETGGAAVGVLACRLVDRRLRDAATYVTPFDPDARFTAARAMARNRIIHALGEATVVVACEAGRGGTRAGALAALRAGVARVMVRTGPGCGTGVDELVAAGAVPVGDNDLLFGPLLVPAPGA